MKRRVIISLSAIGFLIISLIIGHQVLAEKHHGIMYIIGILLIVYAIVFLLFGLPRLIVYFIYGLFSGPIIIFSPQIYQIILSFILTIVIVINPLAAFEQFLDRQFKESETKTFQYSPGGRYKTFYKYRKNMKEYYHLPQVQKLYTNPKYKFLRNFVLIFLFSLLVFLLLHSASDIVIYDGLDFRSIITLYFAFLLMIAVMVLYKSGFTSMFRVFKVSLFPAIIYLLSYSGLSNTLKAIFIIVLALTMTGLIVNESLTYFTRITYNHYHYTDPKTNQKVFANALYEPFIYDDSDKISAFYTIASSEETFNKNLNSLLIYANFKKLIITAYTVGKGQINLYVELYNEKHLDSLRERLHNTFNSNIKQTVIADSNYYEKMFLHKHEYIIARALSLASLLEELEIKEAVIISLSMHFKDLKAASQIVEKYHTNVIEKQADYCLLEVLIKVENIDYIIEASLRNLLLDMLISGGTFVRIMVYY